MKVLGEIQVLQGMLKRAAEVEANPILKNLSQQVSHQHESPMKTKASVEVTPTKVDGAHSDQNKSANDEEASQRPKSQIDRLDSLSYQALSQNEVF